MSERKHSKLYVFCYKVYRKLIEKVKILIPDQLYVQKVFEKKMGQKLDLKNPQTFNQKLQWLLLYNRRPEFTLMVDKYLVKPYVANIIGEEHIIPTLGVYDRFDDIDFDALPEQFVLKCNHDSGGLAICRDKKTFDKNKAKTNITHSLKADFYAYWREYHYKNVKRKIIAEQYMEDSLGTSLTDYKFYCFDGEPKFLYVSYGFENHEITTVSFVDLDWKPMPFGRNDYKPMKTLPPKPAHFDEMIEIAKKLSAGHSFLRVDLYEINNTVYFSELTIIPCTGHMPFDPPEYDKIIGDMLVLPEKYKKHRRTKRSAK